MADSGFDWGQVVSELGIMGVLLGGLYYVIKGKVWPEKMVDKALEAQRATSEQAAKVLATELCEKMGTSIANGIERAIVSGYLRVNGIEEKK